MTELQEKMLHLQTISTIMSNEEVLKSIVGKEVEKYPNLEMEARFVYRLCQLGQMRQVLIEEILENPEFYTPLDTLVDRCNNTTFGK